VLVVSPSDTRSPIHHPDFILFFSFATSHRDKKNSYHWFDFGGFKRRYQRFVVINSCLVNFTDAVGENSGPGNRKSIMSNLYVGSLYINEIRYLIRTVIHLRLLLIFEGLQYPFGRSSNCYKLLFRTIRQTRDLDRSSRRRRYLVLCIFIYKQLLAVG
jgi:hypothetical protein